MRPVIFLAVLIATIASARIACAGDEVRSCDFEVKARCASGQTRVTLKDGVVTRLELDVFWCGLPGRPGYTCMIDSSRGEKDDTWSDEGGATIITNATPFTDTMPDRVKVTIGKYISLDFAEAQSAGRCGAGAELPLAIVIPAQKGACRVWLSKP